jgi:cytochrome c556
MKRNLIVAVAVAALVGIVSVAVSETGGDDAIKDRHLAMNEIGGSMGTLAAMVKKQAPFDAAVVEKNAGAIAERLEKAASLFPEGSDSGEIETWAKPEVWSDAEGFAKAMGQARDAAVELKSVTEAAALGPALGKLGNNCKTCHDKYRRPKQ